MRLATGELAALATALCWTGSATFFTFGSRRVGSAVVNRVRLVLAAVFLTSTHWLIFGSPLPTAGAERWLWLGLSGIVGLAIGDAFLFQAYVWIGARLTMLMMSTVPILSALLAWIALGERLEAAQWLGIALTVLGLAWVVGRPEAGPDGSEPKPDYRRGLIYGLGAAGGQGLGMILAKQGLADGFPPLSGNVMRLVSAALVLWWVTLLQRQAGPTLRRLLDQPRALAPITAGAVTGPFIGVWLSLIAIQTTHIGIASTLMALPPVFLLPVGRFVFGERIGRQAVGATLLAMAGVSMLFLA
ncbi:MAG: DMT family transporter [Chloroflexota bacterium]